jgi:hypothetical protein
LLGGQAAITRLRDGGAEDVEHAWVLTLSGE